jgi:translation elongation factor EF-Tu-like GTPase
MRVTADGIDTVTVRTGDLPKLAPPTRAAGVIMSFQKPDIAAEVRLLAEREGGRMSATPPDHYGCIFVFEGENFECRLLLADAGPVAPGQQAKVGIKFLRPELIKPRLREGSPFTLREVRTIGEGTVERVIE